MDRQKLSQFSLILCGFRGCGKSTIGRALAHRLKWPWIDTDATLDFTAHDFRLQEKRVVQRLPQGRAVISTGGGTLMDPENIDVLKQRGKLIYLELPKAVAAIRKAPHPYDFEEIYPLRLPIYQTVADYTVDATQSVENIIEELITYV